MAPGAPTLEDRAVGALLGTFVGDAVGMAWEGSPPGAIPASLEMEEARLGRGTYTDDTQMMIALAESLLRCGGIDADDLAQTFLAHYDPSRGYGAGTTQVLSLIAAGTPVSSAAREAFGGEGSLGNGAAMRIAPIGVRDHADPETLAADARRSAAVTHAHEVGIDGAVAQASSVGAAMRGDDPLGAALATAATAQVSGALERIAALEGAESDPARLAPSPRGVPPTADQSVAAAAWAGSRAESFERAVTVAIRAGGDTDTVGAMAGAIAGARFGTGSIPERWLDELEEGERGRRYVEWLGHELARAAGGKRDETHH